MSAEELRVVGLRTANFEWFALSTGDPNITDAGLDPGVAKSETELRRQLRLLGLSDGAIDEQFRQARRWMTTLERPPASRH